jgi:hypothetical protein
MAAIQLQPAPPIQRGGQQQQQQQQQQQPQPQPQQEQERINEN